MPPADSASRAGVTPKAGGDRSSRTFANNMTPTGRAISITTLIFAAALLLLCAALPPFGFLVLPFVGIPALVLLLVALLSYFRRR